MRLAQRGKPLAKVHQFGIALRHLILVMQGIPVQGNRFQLFVGRAEDRPAGGLIDPARFHPHQAVFHQIHPADAMLSA